MHRANTKIHFIHIKKNGLFIFLKKKMRKTWNVEYREFGEFSRFNINYSNFCITNYL